MLLNTFGGVLHSSFKVARALRSTFKDIEIYVPHIAASGGTLIALTADKIVMGIMSQLSPLDPQVWYDGQQISALTFRRAYNRLCELFAEKTKDEAPYPQQALADKLDPLLMEDWQGAVETSIWYTTQILQLAKYGEKSERIAHDLVYHFTEHDADLSFDFAKQLELRVERFDSSERTLRIWRNFRRWLGLILFQPSGLHIVRYVLPLEAKENGTAA